MLRLINTQRGRSNLAVNSPINEYLEGNQATFLTDNFINSAGDCTGNVQCDILYDKDWSYRLRVNMPCPDAQLQDPCFAATACICSNGYFRVAEDMPAPPVQYSGLEQNM